MNLVAERPEQKRRPPECSLLEPEPKRLCRSSETVICTSHPPSKCAEDYDSMELDLKQNNPTEFLNPQKMKEKPTLLIFPNNETRTPVQPCPRCIAGEPGHFSHIMNL
ncbi:uncharacterized protein C10orf143 homolog isoform X1 [Anolis sagrei]|uniref:uncharacterized protein C10orf143 homolog isoform X1 n=1 Tax=Anolis sagrei TaxID=38937 RepID=UPI0035205664